MTYHVLPIGLTVLVLYIFSLYLSIQGFTARLSHRRFWNWILLVSFLVTGLIGIFLALRINYRWEIPFAESLRQWHVEAGIAMFLTALIHLSWHLGYYFRQSGRQTGERPDVPAAAKISSDSTVAGKIASDVTPAGKISSYITEADKVSSDVTTGRFRTLLLLIGFVSSSSQFILMREAVILGGGTEAVAGIFLWLWLIVSAAGAMTGGRSAITSLRRMIWTLIAGTALAPLLLISITTIILSPGQTPSIYQTLAILCITVTPVTFISALIFVRISVIRHNLGLAGSGNSFGAETAGSVAAGILTALTVTVRIPNFQLYLLILLLASVTAVWLLERNAQMKIPAIIISLLLGVVLFIKPPDPFFRSMLLRGVRVEKSTDTPFGNITTGFYGGERTVYYHHRPLFYPGDVITSEENIHYALLQRERYDRVLLISGGLSKHLGELVKHSIEEVDYLELDPGLIAAEEAGDTICGTMKVRVISIDPMTFLRENDDVYDAVIQLIPPPSTLSVSRFYTVEYFRMVSEHLSPGGVFMCTPMAWFNYSPQSYRRGFSPLFNALASVFSHVTLIPGSLLYVIASESPVSPEIAQMTGQKRIVNSYVNADYLDDNEIRLKEELILSQVDRTAGMNTATRPVSSLFANMLSLERMGMRGSIIALLTVLIAVPFLFAARRGLLMFASSAGLAGYGMIMIFILQMAVGNIYILSAVILTLLMAGLATGAVWGERLALKKISLCTLLLTAIFILTGLLAPTLVTSPPGPVTAFLFIALPVSGIITGAVYRLLTSRDADMVTGKIYSADMAGSALGYLTAATLLVPMAGTANSCFILAALILISGAVASLTIKQ